MKKYLVIDIGGSAIKHAIINENYELSDKGKIPTPMEGKEAVYKVIAELAGNAEDIEGIAISMPGAIDRVKGYVHTGGALYFLTEIDMVRELEAIVKLPVTICNDAKSAALAELSTGLDGKKNVLVLVVGTGIGGGIIIDGKLYEGSHFVSGEVSVILVDPENSEEYERIFAGRSGIAGLAGTVQKYSGLENLTGIEVFQRIRQGDEAVKKGMEKYCDNMAVQIFNMQSILDVELVLIGGGISAENMFIEMVRDSMKKLFEPPYLPVRMPEVEACRYRNDANLIGAFYNFKMLKGLEK